MTNSARLSSTVREPPVKPASPAVAPTRPPLSAAAVAALQRSAGNQAVTQMLSQARVASIQRIKGGVETYKGTWVKQKNGDKVGQIDGVKNNSTYWVNWTTAKPRVFDRKAVPANQLEEDAERNAQPEGDGAKVEEKTPEPKRDETDSEELLAVEDFKPTHLKVKKAWSGTGGQWFKLRLLDANEVDVGTCELQQANAKLYLTHAYVGAQPKKIEPKTWKLLRPPGPGPLLDAHLIRKRQLIKEKEAQGQINAFLATLDDDDSGAAVEQPDHDVVYALLRGFSPKEDHGVTGHHSVTMFKVQLLKPHTLLVAGVQRDITHAYTQVGSPTEIRCYLGNEEGAYQRVHTSLTIDNRSQEDLKEGEKKEKKAHTMVQTGKQIAVPGWVTPNTPATRVGLDSERARSPALANASPRIAAATAAPSKAKARPETSKARTSRTSPPRPAAAACNSHAASTRSSTRSSPIS